MAKEIRSRLSTHPESPIITGAAVATELHGSYDRQSEESFYQAFYEWIYSSEQSFVYKYNSSHIVSGIADAFNQTYSLYNKIGLYKGEYGYHEKVFPDRITFNLKEADVIIISHPFSADGNCAHSKLKEADNLGIPIFVDCAFFGICAGIDFDFTPYNNIHSVCFSLSKTFGTGWQRVGMLFTNDNYPVSVYDGWNYPLTSSSMYHYNLIKKYGPDDIYRKYRFQQEEICGIMNIQTSSTVIFGLDYTDQYNEYKRGNVNRLCISKEFNNESI